MPTVTSHNKADFDRETMEKRGQLKQNKLIPIYHGTSHETAKKIE